MVYYAYTRPQADPEHQHLMHIIGLKTHRLETTPIRSTAELLEFARAHQCTHINFCFNDCPREPIATNAQRATKWANYLFTPRSQRRLS